MKSLHTVVFLLMILSAFCIAPAAAQITAEPVISLEMFDPKIPDITRAPPITGSVTQGETKYHTSYVPAGKNTLEVQLNWNRATGNDLDLVIRPPSQAPITFHDPDDGRLDGNIRIRFTLPHHLTGTNWDFDIKGAQVTGTQSYTLTVNAY